MMERFDELVAEIGEYTSDTLLASDEPEKLAAEFRRKLAELSALSSAWPFYQ